MPSVAVNVGAVWGCCAAGAGAAVVDVVGAAGSEADRLTVSGLSWETGALSAAAER